MKEFPIYTIKRRNYTLPYYLPECKKGGVSITTKRHEPGEELTVVSIRNAIFMGLSHMKLKLDSPTYTHWLKEDGVATWMSSYPQEIEQHMRQLECARGRVLVGGLGLGVAVALLERNSFVESIVCVEKNQTIIDLILPWVPKRKTTIVRGDLYAYLKKCKRMGVKFDFAFYDIWCPTGQRVLTEHVIPLRRLSVDVVPQGEIECWNEQEMLGQIAISLQTTCTQIAAPDADIHPLLKSDDRIFHSKDAKKAQAETWTFLHWVRKTKPTVQQAADAVPRFIAALKDPELFDREWKEFAP